MKRRWPLWQYFLASVALGLAVSACLVAWRFSVEIEHARARARAEHADVVVATRCGAIEYQEAGAGVPLLAVHGSGGGHGQGMAFARPLTRRGIRVMAAIVALLVPSEASRRP